MNENERIAKNTIFLYFRMLFTLMVSLYTSRVILKVLGVEDFGIYNVVGGIVGIFSFISSSLAASTQRFITFELGNNNYSEINRVFNTSLIIHVIIAFFIFILSETIGLWFLYNKMNIPLDRVNSAFWVFQFSIASMIIMLLSIPYNALIIAHEKMSAFAYISIVDISLRLVVVYLLIACEGDKLIIYAMFLFVVQIFIRSIYGYYCSHNFEESKLNIVIDLKLIKKMLAFVTWALWGNLSVAGYTHGLNILLNIFFNPIVNAARGIAVQVQSAISLLVTNFQMAINPQITKNYAASNFQRLYALIFFSSKYSFYLAMIIVIPLYFETSYLLHVWLPEVPEYSVSFVKLLSLILLIDTLANPISAAISATGIIKYYQIVVGGVQLLILPISFVFLKCGFSPIIVYVVHLSIAVIVQSCRLIFAKQLIKLPIYEYLYKVIFRILSVFILTFIITKFFHNKITGNIIALLVIVFVSILSIVISVYIIGMDVDERNKLKDLIKKRRSK